MAGYYKNPNVCRNCQQIIRVEEGKKIQSARRKKCCSKKCAYAYQTIKRPVVEKQPRKSLSTLSGRTKGDLFASCNGYQSARSRITRHARFVAKENGIASACAVCGYIKHVEVAHKKAVSDFLPDALISEINAPDNLVGLCPNHHWEYDAGLLAL